MGIYNMEIQEKLLHNLLLICYPTTYSSQIIVKIYPFPTSEIT